VRPISVLIVDHSSTFSRIAAFFLHECYQGEVAVIGLARGGEEALEQAQALQPDVVLIDVPTPERSGLGAISRLRETLPQVGIIVLGLLDTDSYQQAAVEAGADDFVPKATLASNLLPAIRRVTHTKQFDQSFAGPGAVEKTSRGNQDA
jgi:DNA-binding NarL/FixJ family response regulator